MSAMQQFAPERHAPRGPMRSGLARGEVQAASPLLFRWLEPATLRAMHISLVAAICISFAVADGRPKVIAVGRPSLRASFPARGGA